jgi:hypothetical protein
VLQLENQIKDDNMVDLIEDQIHKYLIEKEENRCIQEEKKKGKPCNRRTISKPWKRTLSVSLCTNTDLLCMVTKFDYDLSNSKFQSYCIARGTLHEAGIPGSRRWDFFENHQLTELEYLADQYFHYAQEFEGKRYKYTSEELQSGWRIIMSGRASLQDCWEIFLKNKDIN